MIRPLFPLAVLFLSTLSAQDRIPLHGNLHPQASAAADQGPLDPAVDIAYASLAFQKSPAQQQALDTLLLEQQIPGSPNFHRWLTPEEFADRFGPTPADVAGVVDWLKSQGLTVHDVARGRGFVTFSGTAQHIATAFRTELHQYRVNGQTHFANATELSVPAALAPLILGIQGLNDFRLPPLGRMNAQVPDATSADGTHTLAPDDLATIYSLNKLYSAGLDGTGQTLAVVGESDFDVTQIRNFRSRYNLPVRDPKVVLYGPDPGITGADIETYFDLEWAGAVARNATLIYVNSSSVILSAAYAISNNIAPVMSFSYGYCEQESPSGLSAFLQALAQQANAQGITWVAAAGDAGAATCDTDEPLAVKGAAVSFPASLPEITAVGGSQLNEGTGTFWSSSNNPNGASALSYIPETTWNDSALFGSPTAAGGGASVFYQKPFWQTGAGVPADNARDLPDVVFPAAYHDSYNVCVFGSCGSGAFGTSLSAQAFAGVVALLNQYLTLNHFALPGAGAGNINPQLYLLAASAPNVFHDIASGNNTVGCVATTPNCVQGKLGFNAAPAYDQATGLGSVDAFNLIAAWSTITARPTAVVIPSLTPSAFTLSDSAKLTATVVATKGTAVPDGTVTFYLGSRLLGSAPVQPVTGVQSASLTVYGSQFAPGPNQVLAIYNGNSNFAISSGTVAVTVSVPVNNSAVIPSVNPNPVYQHAPDASGNSWTYTISLTNATKVPTTLTDFTVDGVSLKSQIATLFSNAAIPASGRITATQSAAARPLPYTRILGFSGTDAGGFQWTQQIPVTFVGPEFSSFIDFAGNAASGQIAAAPGMLLVVFGQNIATGLPASGLEAKTLPLPTTLGGVSATLNGIPIPMIFVSSSQVDLQVPYNTPLGNSLLKLTSNGQTNLFSVGVVAVAPGIFTDAQGLTVPYGSGSRGKTFTLFITGEGAISPPLANGATPPSTTPVSQLPVPVQPVSMTIGGVAAPVVFRGIPSGEVGVTQINFTVPATAPLGVQPVIVRVGNISSPAAFFTVTK